MNLLKTIVIGLAGLFASAIYADDIKLGMSTALSGQSAALGQNIRAGVESYFQYVNQQGGVNGRSLKLIVKDDGYEPKYAAHNMRALIDDDGVLAVIGNVGTPTAIVTAPIAKQKQTLLFGAFTGANILRTTPPSRYVINYRPSYQQEMDVLISGLLDSGVKPEEMAFFTQQDGFGNTGFSGAVNALKSRGYSDTSNLCHVRYTRNTVNVESAVAKILAGENPPKAIILVASYAASARFIELLQPELPDTWFFNLSFAGSHSLMKSLPETSNQVVVNQVVPSIDADLPIVQEYLEHLQHYAPSHQANDVSLEGYIIAKIFHQGLLNIDGDINNESIIDGLENINALDIGIGVPISYSSSVHDATSHIWMSMISKGQLMPFSWSAIDFSKP